MKGICMTQPKTWTKRRNMKRQCFMTNGEDPRNESTQISGMLMDVGDVGLRSAN